MLDGRTRSWMLLHRIYGLLVQFACHIQIIATCNKAIFHVDGILAKDRVVELASITFPLSITTTRDALTGRNGRTYTPRDFRNSPF
jgi:hypothetical protein